MINYLLDIQYTTDYYRFELPNNEEISIYPGAKYPGAPEDKDWFTSYVYQDRNCRYTFIDTPSFQSKHNGMSL